MLKAIDLAGKIAKEPDKDFSTQLEDTNLHLVFQGLYAARTPRKDSNLATAFIIYCYDPDSQKIDIKKDRLENKLAIARSMGMDLGNKFLFDMIHAESDQAIDAITLFLETLTSWKWAAIFTLVESSSNNLRFAARKTEQEKTWTELNKDGQVQTLSEDYDIDKLTKAEKEKSILIERAIEDRKKADALLGEIQKEYMYTDHAVREDFNLGFTDSSKKKINIESWREFIQARNSRKASEPL